MGSNQSRSSDSSGSSTSSHRGVGQSRRASHSSYGTSPSSYEAGYQPRRYGTGHIHDGKAQRHRTPPKTAPAPQSHRESLPNQQEVVGEEYFASAYNGVFDAHADGEEYVRFAHAELPSCHGQDGDRAPTQYPTLKRMHSTRHH